jgi:shikimate kinase
MGVGKTTIGKKLAKSIGLPFIDTDQVFEAEHGAISDFFDEQGEAKFRELEEEIVTQAITKDAVIATGGGSVLSDHIRAELSIAFVVYLATDGRHISSRLSGGGRPLLKNGLADWRRIYESRKGLYEEVADLQVDTSKLPLASIIEKIMEGLAKDDRF